ncbi:MAG: tetratricopeptide repeat protein [Bacteroidota bacterium]
MNDRIDLLKKQLSEAHSEKEKIDLLNTLASELKYINHEEALDNAKKALHLAIEIDYLKGIAYARLYLGISMFLMSKVENILENFLEALDYFKTVTHEPGYPETLNYMGNVYESYGAYEKALGYSQRSLKIAEEYNHVQTSGDAHSTIGIIYTRLADYNKAIDSFKESLKIRKNLKDYKALASSLNWLARNYTLLKNYNKAKLYYEKSIELRKRTNNPALPWSYLGIASLYESMGKNGLAIKNYRKSLKLNEQTKEKRCNLHCYLGMGKVFSKQEKFQKGIEYLVRSLSIAESLKAKPVLFEIHLSLAENYEKSNNLAEALKHYRLYQKFKEEVMNSEMLNKLRYQQINFAIEKSQQESEIFQLRNVELRDALKQIEIKNQEITDSIEYASRIQTVMLPPEDYLNYILSDYFVFFKPKGIVSGDFYWVKKINNYIIFAIADCTGHGVPGAFISMLGMSFLNEILQKTKITQANQVLNELRHKIKETLRQTGEKGELYDGMDISLCALNTETNILQFSGANNPLYIIHEGEFIEIKPDKMPIGYYPNEKPSFTNHEIQLNSGDTFYLFSDGFMDQFGGRKGFKYKPGKFQQVLFENYKNPLVIQKELLEHELKNWMKGYEQTDDILVMGVRV